MKGTHFLNRTFALFLSLCMMLSAFSGTAFAVELEPEGVCPHHTEHTMECGYEKDVNECDYACEICNMSAGQDMNRENSESEQPEKDRSSLNIPEEGKSNTGGGGI